MVLSSQESLLPRRLLAWIIHEEATAVADSSKSQGVLLPGARRAVDARARPNGTGPAPLQSAHPACEARRLTTLAIRLRIALDPTSLRFFMNNPG